MIIALILVQVWEIALNLIIIVSAIISNCPELISKIVGIGRW